MTDVLKCIITTPGEQCVMTDSLTQQQELLVTLSDLGTSTFESWFLIKFLCVSYQCVRETSTTFRATFSAEDGCMAYRQEGKRDSGIESKGLHREQEFGSPMFSMRIR